MLFVVVIALLVAVLIVVKGRVELMGAVALEVAVMLADDVISDVLVITVG